jgi:hypothetical protein
MAAKFRIMALFRSSSSSEEFPLALWRALRRASLGLRLCCWSSLDLDLDLDRVLDLDLDLDLDLESFLPESDSVSDLEFLRQDSELDSDLDFLDLDLDFDLDRERLDDSDELGLELGSSLALRPLLPFLFFPLPRRLLLESASDLSSDLSDDLLFDFLRDFFASCRVLSGEEDLPWGGSPFL